MSAITKHEARAFIRGYLDAALWSSHDWRTDKDSDSYDPDSGAGEYLDHSYDAGDLQPDCRADVRSECFEFLRRACEEEVDLRELADFHQHGADFWLTRAGHGVGFWDRGYGDAGDVLSKICDEVGSRDAVDNGDFFIIE